MILRGGLVEGVIQQQVFAVSALEATLKLAHLVPVEKIERGRDETACASVAPLQIRKSVQQPDLGGHCHRVLEVVNYLMRLEVFEVDIFALERKKEIEFFSL